MSKSNSAIHVKSYAMALAVVKLVKAIRAKHREYDLTKQLIRSGTNPGAMVMEAYAGESKKDFLHKLKVGRKEAKETEFWLRLLGDSDFFIGVNPHDAVNYTQETIRLLTSIINKTEANLKKNGNGKVISDK